MDLSPDTADTDVRSGIIDSEADLLARLNSEPANTPLRLSLARNMRNARRTRDAESLIREGIQLDPANPDLNLALAESLSLRRADKELKSLFETLIQGPLATDPRFWYLEGQFFQRKGQTDNAREKFSRCIAQMPEWISPYVDLANVLIQGGRFNEGTSVLLRALEKHPSHWKIHYNLARCFDQLGKINPFNKHLSEALRLSPSPNLVYSNLAQTRLAHGDPEGAERCFRQALESTPDDLYCRLGLAEALIATGRIADAESHLTACESSRDVQLVSRLATVRWNLKQFDQGIALLKRICELAPDNVEAWFNLSSALLQSWRLQDALDAVAKARMLDPTLAGLDGVEANIRAKRGENELSLSLFRKAIANDPDNTSLYSSLAFASLYSDTLSAADKFTLHKHLSARIENGITPFLDWPWSSHERLRIGYISADFRDQHPVGIFIRPVMEHHDRSKFEIYCYYNSSTIDESTQQIRRHADHWLAIDRWSDEKVCKRIREDEIDILVDLSGHTQGHRLRTFARHPAKSQFTMIGYPGSTGMRSLDYFIADPVVAPDDKIDLYSENLLRLPACVFSYPRDGIGHSPDVVRRPADDPIVFGSFNNLTKITPATIDVWTHILLDIPDSSLYMKTPSFADSATAELVRRQFVNRGISPDRLHLEGPCALYEMLNDYNKVDVGLDPIPFNGGTTTYQALWMGVPVVTLPGDEFSSRMGASIMSAIGLPEYIASSPENYIETAKRITTDRESLRELKAGLRQRMQVSPLCDNVGYTRALEELFGSGLSRTCRGTVVDG